MARSTSEQPTEGELNILRVLWRHGLVRLSVLCEALAAERRLAPSTVATMLKIMQRKGQVKRVVDRDGIRWQAVLSQAEAGRGLLANLVERVFEGSAHKVVLHLLDDGQLTAEHQEQIRKLLAARARRAHS